MTTEVIAFCIGGLLAFSDAVAQRPEQGPPAGINRMVLQYQPLFVGPSDSTVRCIDIPYRVDLGFFVASRSGLASSRRPLKRKGELLFEFFDSSGSSAGRVIEEIDQSTEAVRPPEEGHEWYQGIATLSLPPGTYSVVTELTDLESKRDMTDKEGKTIVPQRSSTPGLGSVFFGLGDPGSAFPDTMILQNFGKDFLFGSGGYVATTLIGLNDTTGVSIGYTISEAGRSSRDHSADRHVESAHYLSLAHCSFVPYRDSDRVGFRVFRQGAGIGIVIPLPLATLPLRDYDLTLTVKHGDQHAVVDEHCRAIWPDMPASLRDVDRAIDALRILLPDAVVDRMKKGSFESRRDTLEAFWNSRSANSGSALNPLMAEYYHRVDAATRNYATLRQADGLKTDRGRIYVLYGPPSSTERTLTPGKPYQEVWVYDKLNKRFVFEDTARNGNYILLSSTGS